MQDSSNTMVCPQELQRQTRHILSSQLTGLLGSAVCGGSKAWFAGKMRAALSHDDPHCSAADVLSYTVLLTRPGDYGILPIAAQ